MIDPRDVDKVPDEEWEEFKKRAAKDELFYNGPGDMLDNPEGSEEYENAKATLANHDGLVAELYNMATTDVYDDGSCCFSQAAASYLKDIRFCGKEWLMARCEARIKKAGY